MSTWTPEPTGDPQADRVLDTLTDAETLAPEEEAAVYSEALEALTALLESDPQHPGTPGHP